MKTFKTYIEDENNAEFEVLVEYVYIPRTRCSTTSNHLGNEEEVLIEFVMCTRTEAEIDLTDDLVEYLTEKAYECVADEYEYASTLGE